jgi:hypothetical protein
MNNKVRKQIQLMLNDYVATRDIKKKVEILKKIEEFAKQHNYDLTKHQQTKAY